MLPWVHFLFALATTPVYLLLTGDTVGGVWFFAAQILVDADHYLFYVYKLRDLSLVRAYNYCKPVRKENLPALMIFHNVLLPSMLITLAWIVPQTGWICIPLVLGLMCHYTLDLIRAAFYGTRFFKWFIVY
jgi:hypothetical protein